MNVGQRVSIKPGGRIHASQAGQTYEVAKIVGRGRDMFAKLRDRSGAPVPTWFLLSDLAPASTWSSTRSSGQSSPPTPSNAGGTLLMLAESRMRQQPDLSLRDAVRQIAAEYPTTAATYLNANRQQQQRIDACAPYKPQDVTGQLAELVRARAKEKNLSYGDAMREIFLERPDLAEQYVAAVRPQFCRYPAR